MRVTLFPNDKNNHGWGCVMNDDDLLAQSANVQTIFLDGFGCIRKENGALRCTGFVNGIGAQVNLIISLSGADDAAHETRRVLDEKGSPLLRVWEPVLTH